MKVESKARTTRDFLQQQLTWSRRTLFEPMKQRTSRLPNQEEVYAWVERVLVSESEDRLDGECGELLEQFNELVKGRALDSFGIYLATELHYRAFRNPLMRTEKLQSAAESWNLRQDAGALPWMLNWSLVEARGEKATPQEFRRALDALNEAWKKGAYTVDDWPLLTRQLLERNEDQWAGPERGEETLAVLKTHGIPEWVEAAFRGSIEVNRAWKSRGRGWAGTVTDEGWKGFAEHLVLARKHLTRAWELKPEEPTAAAHMIVVAKGESAGQEEIHRWLDRALAATCDHEGALSAYINALMPRWGGSHGKMLSFARRTLAANRYDTRLPLTLFTVLDEIDLDARDPSSVYRHPSVRPLVLETNRRLLAEPSRAGERALRTSLAAVDAWLAGDAPAATEALRIAPGKLHPHAQLKLNRAHADERFLRGEVATLSSPAAEFWRSFQDGRAKRSWPEANESLEKAREQTGSLPEVRSFLEAWQAVLNVEQALDKGDWVDIPLNTHLQGWTKRSGQFQSSPDGLPNWTGPVADYLAWTQARKAQRAFYDARVGANFEVRAEFGAPKSRTYLPSVGLYFGMHFGENSSEQWQACAVWTAGKSGALEGGYLNRDNPVKGVPTVAVESSSENFVFEIRVRDGQLTWQFNGQPMQSDVKLSTEIPADARIGIGTYAVDQREMVTLKKLRIRCPLTR